jgi:thiol-disulfide isomerase/thioredoxin
MIKNKTFLVAFCSLALVAPRALAGEFPDSWTWDDDSKIRADHATLEGKPMPSLDTSAWINGEVRPADFKGKVVIVDFYATWCGPCMAAIPHNNELLKKYKDQGLVIVGVCTSKRGQENMASVVKERGIEYPTARDANLTSQEDWHVHYYPTYAIVDRKGIVRAIGLQPQNVETVVKKLLAEPAP